MSSYILAQTVGFLVSHLLGLMVDIILKKEDIASSDAEYMATQLDHMVERLKEIMTVRLYLQNISVYLSNSRLTGSR